MERGVFRGHLDDEQRIVFAHVLDGKSGREIAAALQMTPGRVEHIVRKTCRQLGADGRKDAARIIANQSDNRHHTSRDSLSRIAASINHNGADFSGVATKAVPTASDRQINGAYVRDVGGNASSQVDTVNILDEIAGMFGRLKPFDAVPLEQRILLIAFVVLCSTIALSALVSTLQGFDKLTGS